MLSLIVALIAMNGIAFCAFGYDKRQARLRGWRVSERRLLMLAACGGWVGAKLGQRYFRHKTYPSPFRTKLDAIPYVLAVVAAAAIAIYVKNNA